MRRIETKKDEEDIRPPDTLTRADKMLPSLPSRSPYTHATQPRAPYSSPRTQNNRRLAPHDVGLTVEGVALSEKDSTTREPVVDGIVKVYVLPRVLYAR
jgi:hypothetical protein